MYAVSVVQDVVFASCGGVPLRADLYLPDTGGDRVPVIVWVHAGGWRFGTRKLAPDLSRFFAQRGLAMAAVDYRLTHQASFPAQVADLKTAIRWLRSVADDHGFDRTRIGLWGSSAGGHLAALAALTPCGMFEPPGAPWLEHAGAVQAVAAGYPPVDFLQLDAHRPPPGTKSEDPDSLLLPRPDMRSADADSFESLLLGAPIETCPDKVRAANPLTYAAPGAPPFLIMHGLADTTIAPHQSELLYRGLVAHGIRTTLCLVDGLGHGFLHRTRLDDGPARRMLIRRHTPGRRERRIRRSGPVFPLVEEFFRETLGGGVNPPPVSRRRGAMP